MSGEALSAKSENGEAKGFLELTEEIQKRGVSVISELRYTNNEAEKEFLANDTMVRPNFVYGNLDRDVIIDNLKAIDGLRGEVNRAQLSQSEELFARTLINDVAERNAVVESCAGYNSARSPEERAKYAELFRFANDSLYGKPDEDTFYALLSEELSNIDVDNLSPEDAEVYNSLRADIGDIKTVAVDRFKPKQETVERFSEQIGVLFEGFWKHIPKDKEIITTQEACDITNEILREEIGEDATVYRAIMDDKSKSISVSHEKRAVVFPVKRSKGDFTQLSFKQILTHELGTHVLRALVYENHEIPALSSELPGSGEIDEGIAKCCEQAVAGKYSDSGTDHYINVGLATFKGKNFREVFEIQRKLEYLKGIKPGETPEEKEARFHAKDSDFFERTVRCFRGTGELPNNKDLIYYRGAERVWRFIEENLEDPELLDKLFLSAKSDILNADQQRLVYETKVS